MTAGGATQYQHVMIQEGAQMQWDPFDSVLESAANQYQQPAVDEKLYPLVQKQIKEFRTLKQLDETLKQ